MLDHVEQRLLRPVDVLEHEDERLRVRELLAPPERRPAQLPRRTLASLRSAEHAQRGAEQVGDRFALAGGAQLLERLARRVVVADPRARLDHRGERPVGHALAVGERPPPECRHALETLGELGDEARLAEARLPEDGQELSTAIPDCAGEGVLEQSELRLAPDERRNRVTIRFVCPDRPPRPERLRTPLDLERPGVVDFHGARGEPAGSGAEQDLARLGRLLQAGGEVDGLARREGRVRVVDHDLARLDADANGELQLLDLRNDLECSANGPLGVVLVRERHAEGGHHRVAGELLDGASVRLDPARDDLEIAVHALTDDLRIRARDQARRVDEVCEEDGCDLALHVRIVRAEG